MTLAAIVTRLFVAALIGCLIGINRFAHHRYIGVRTLGLVSLGAAAVVVAALENGSTVWVAAVTGILCGLGAWRVVLTVTVLVGIVLLAGGPVEKLLVARYGCGPEEDPPTSIPPRSA